MNLAELRKLLATKQAGLQELETKAAADEASDEDVAALDTAVTDIEKLEKKIALVAKSEAQRAKAAKPADSEIDAEDEDEDLPEPKVKKDLTPAEKLGLIVQGMTKAHGDVGNATERTTLKAIEELGYPQFAKDFSRLAKKNLNSAQLTAGGVMVPTVQATEMIPLLYKKATFMASGPRRIPMPNGNYQQPAGATGATAAYRGEGKPMGVSYATAREIKMSAKLLSSVTTLTEQLVRYSLADAAGWAQNDLAQAMSLTADYNGYFGSGTAYAPKGILTYTDAPTFAFVAGTAVAPTYAEFDTAGANAEQLMVNVGMPIDGCAWLMSFRTFSYMQNLRTSQGDFVFPTMQGSNPTWRNKPVRWTQIVPNNLGGGTNESVIALISWDNILYGETYALSFKLTREATIKKPDGSLINTWQEGVLGMAYEAEHDFGSRYAESVVVISGVRAGG
jgi:HK97 family phage major capsid protein